MKRLFWMISAAVMVVAAAAPAPAEVMTAPSGFGSVRAYPNPWKADQNGNAFVTIDGLPASAVTRARIFTISGELVRTLSGTQKVQWDLRNNSGENVASGIYIYLLDANGEQHSGKIAVIR